MQLPRGTLLVACLVAGFPDPGSPVHAASPAPATLRLAITAPSAPGQSSIPGSVAPPLHPERASNTPPASSQTRGGASGPAGTPDTDDAADPSLRQLRLPLVGATRAYVPRRATSHVVLLVSGARGWTRDIDDLARRVARTDVVVGVPFPALKRAAARGGGCWFVAGDLELLSHVAQRQLRLPEYIAPVLAGEDEGGSVVFAALAAAPSVTFAAAVSIGFSERLKVHHPVCDGDAWSPEFDWKRREVRLTPAPALPKDWWVLPRDGASTGTGGMRGFVSGTARAHLVESPVADIHRTDHTAHTEAAVQAVQRAWAGAQRAVAPVAAAPTPMGAADVQRRLDALNLPLTCLWPSARAAAVLVFFSGDGGWAALDQDVSQALTHRGIGVVGISSLRYFWNEKPPATVAGDLARVVSAIEAARAPILVGGYSFGASVAPFAVQALGDRVRALVSALVLISPSESASFQIDPMDWVREAAADPNWLVLPAIRALGLPTLCVAGLDEEGTMCADRRAPSTMRTARLPGSHHFRGDYDALAGVLAPFVLDHGGTMPPSIPARTPRAPGTPDVRPR